MQTTTSKSKQSTDNTTVNQLNTFLRGELSASETYRLALSKLGESPNRSILEQCARSHEERARLLTSEVERLGGAPADGSGAWGTFAKLVEAGAQLFGEKSAIAALEEGEDHGKSEYDQDLSELDRSTRALVEAQLRPEQLRTHQAMRLLKKSLAS
jgi:uncharacterized protein (TIGR02284 family)